MNSLDTSSPDENKPTRKQSLKERIEANRGAGSGAMVVAIAGAIVLGPVGAIIGGAIGGGLGSLIDRKFRRKKKEPRNT